MIPAGKVERGERKRTVDEVDANRRGDFPNQSFDFLGFTFRARKALGRGRQPFACFLPAASPKALTSTSRTVRRWALHHRSDKSLQDLVEMYNPCIRGWINYYSHFYKTQLRPTLKRIDLYVIRWARRSSSGCVARPRGRETGLTGYAE
jgi:RNA-directed DNA polymerase